MRILLIQRHYVPDVPTYALISHEVAQSLVEDGHSVTVITGFPSYQNFVSGPTPPAEDSLDGVQVMRLRSGQGGRAMIRFCLAALWRARKLRRTIDAVITLSEPPILLSWLVTMGMGRRVAQVQVLQDIHPEAGLAVSAMRPGILAKILRAMDRSNARRTSATVVLSNDMAAYYDDTRPVRNLHVINNFRLGTTSRKPDHIQIDTGKTNVTFAGNLGRFQNLDSVMDAARELVVDGNVMINLIGSGTEFERLQSRIAAENLSNVRLIDRVPWAEAQWYIENSDVCLISLARGVHRFSYPSKTMSYVEAGRPIIAIVEPESSLASDIKSHNLGLVAEPSGEAIARAIATVIEHPSGFDYAARPFDRESALKRWRTIINELAT